jgi:hypothetical protein
VSGDRIFLYRPGQTSLVDAVVVKNRLRGRSADHPGEWLYPDVATPGAANHFSLNDDVVINEIMYHPRPLAGTADVPATYSETTLIPLDAATLWRYNASGTDLDPPPDPVNDWYQTIYSADDEGWDEGAGLIGYETALPGQLPAPIRTTLANPASPPAPVFIRTYYFQTTFMVGDTSNFDQIKLRHVIDDGAAFYLNGQEVARYNLPGNVGDPLDFTATATGVDNAVFVEDLSIPVSALIPNAQNVLSVEVHQGGTNSSDVLFGLELIARRQLTPFIPGQPFRESEQQWVELYNRGDAAVDLTEWELGGGIDYEFAPGTTIGAGEYLVIARDVPAMQADYPSIDVTGPF